MKNRAEERTAHAVAWRDKYIRQLCEELEGREEKERLLTAFLKCMMVRQCNGGEEAVEFSAEEITNALYGWEAAVTGEAGRYRVALSRSPAPEEGEAPHEA